MDTVTTHNSDKSIDFLLASNWWLPRRLGPEGSTDANDSEAGLRSKLPLRKPTCIIISTCMTSRSLPEQNGEIAKSANLAHS